MLLNNICEVFNAKLLDGRDRPIINTLEYVRDYMLKRIVLVREVIEKSPGPLTPTATKLFQSIKDQANEYTAQWNGGNLYGVTGPWGSQHVVDTLHRTCSCRKWELTGIPCKHAVATIWNMAANRVEVGLPETWVHPCYRLDTWRTVYSHLINPIHSKILWPKSDIPTTIIPPNYHPPIGRPPKKRKMSLGESIPLVNDGKLSRKGKTVTCVLCKGKGHNKRTCTGVRNVASGSTNVGNKKRKSTNGPSGSTNVGNKKSRSTNGPSGSNVAANKTQTSATPSVAATKKKTPSVAATKKKTPTKRKSATQPTAKASKLN